MLKPAKVVLKPDSTYSMEKRKWQGCPSVEKTKNGTLYAGWFSGGPYEPHPENYSIVARSLDDGKTWEEPFLVIAPVKEEKYRAVDVQLWIDPDDKLWVMWTQTRVLTEERSVDSFDGVFGVWAITTENPDDDNPTWSEPRRLCDGYHRCKPTALSNGSWVFPAYDWVHHSYVYYETKDNGNTFEKRIGPQKDGNNRRMFDETMIVELNDKGLWLLARTHEGVARSISKDGGKTWSQVENPAFSGPCSRFFIHKLKSGNLLFINHHEFTGRSHLTAFLSMDNGETWGYKLLIDERKDVSYPDAVEDVDGKIFMIYDRERHGAKEILMACFTEEDIKAGDFVSPKSYTKRIVSKVY